MTKLPRLAVLLILPLGAFAADPALLQMVPPDAQVLAGLEVTQAKNSLFGQYVLTHLSVNDTGLQEFTAETGFDPRQDVSEIVVASNGQPKGANNHWLVLADGTFNASRITAAAQSNGAVPATYQGVNLITHAGANSQQTFAVAFLSSTTALAGDLASVQGAIARKQSSAPADSSVLAKAQQVSSANDFWFVTLAPLSNFAGAIPNSNLGGAMQGNVLAGINQTSGGAQFGTIVTISAEAVARSAQDAQSLVDVVKFLAGLVQMNKQNNPSAGQVATLLDSLQATASGNVTTISLAIPEQQLEQLLNSAQSRPRTTRASLRTK
jgi:hypothetical protein